MAEDIVTCPGCAKKFRIPEGAPGGTFQCTACNASVPYGKAAGKAAPAAKGRVPAAAPRAPAPAAAPARGGGRRGRRQEAEEEPEERGRRGRAKSKGNDQQVVLWVSIGAVAAVALIAFLVMNKKEPPPAEPPPTQAAGAQTQPQTPLAEPPTPAPAPAPAPTASGTEPGPAGSTAPAAGGDKPAGTGGIGGAKTNQPLSAAGSALYDSLFVRIDDIPGVTPQERDAMDKDVALFVDRGSGKAGTDAGRRLRKQARKAVPPLLSAFHDQWKRTKWDDELDKWSSFQVQQLLIEIVKADRPGGDFVARHVPQDHASVPATDFQRAARMWVEWWTRKGGKDIEKFKDFAE